MKPNSTKISPLVVELQTKSSNLRDDISDETPFLLLLLPIGTVSRAVMHTQYTSSTYLFYLGLVGWGMGDLFLK